MAVNKVVFGGETVIDLTKDTVSPETLAEGVTAHDKSGKAIVGTMQAGGGDAGGSSIDEFLSHGIEGAYVNDTLVSARMYAFAGNEYMTSADFAKLEYMDMNAFGCCYELKALFLRVTTGICFMGDICQGVFFDTAIYEGRGCIFVPRALMDAYKSDTLWEAFADYFRALEDFTVDGTVTGAIDWDLVDEELSSIDSGGYALYVVNDPETGDMFGTGTTISGEPGMSWYDWVYSDYNADGMFALSDDEMYVMCMCEYYVTTPVGWAIPPDMPIDTFDNVIYVTHIDIVQGVE